MWQVLWFLAPALPEMAMMFSEALLGLAALVFLFGSLKGLVELLLNVLRGCWNRLADPDVQRPEGPEVPGDSIPEGPGRLAGTGSSEGSMMADPSLHSEFGEALTNMMKEALKKDARSDHADMHAEDLETQKRKEMKEALEAKVVMSAEAQEVLKKYAATGDA